MPPCLSDRQDSCKQGAQMRSHPQLLKLFENVGTESKHTEGKKNHLSYLIFKVEKVEIIAVELHGLCLTTNPS